jgi:lysozyme
VRRGTKLQDTVFPPPATSGRFLTPATSLVVAETQYSTNGCRATTLSGSVIVGIFIIQRRRTTPMNREESVENSYEETIMSIYGELQTLSSLLSRYSDYAPHSAWKIVEDTEPAFKYRDDQPRGQDGRWIAGEGSTSEKGVNFIKRREGFRPRQYLDQGKRPTIGYGHLLRSGEKYPNGISKAEALKLLAQDIKTVETAIQEKVKVGLKENEFDALTSLIFNIGTDNFEGSTLLSLLNKGKYNRAADEFPKWNNVRINGVLVPSSGLTKRRKLEQEIFLHGKYQ